MIIYVFGTIFPILHCLSHIFSWFFFSHLPWFDFFFFWSTIYFSDHQYFFNTQWVYYYIHSCTMIITTQFYSISIPNPQPIPPPLNLSPLETMFFKVCELVSVLQRSSVCPFFQIPHQWKHLMFVSHCMADFTWHNNF